MDKFKVGDKVRSKCYGEGKVVEEMGGEILVQFEKNNPCLHSASCSKNGPYKDNTCYWYKRYTNQLEILKNEYTYEDLKKSPIGTKVTFENEKIFFKIANSLLGDGYKYQIVNPSSFNSVLNGKIKKIEEPTYTTVYEHKEEILDETEKRYLKGIIRPFKEKVTYISKLHTREDKEFISINLKNGDYIDLPLFKENIMYKKMIINKDYTLKELGL